MITRRLGSAFSALGKGLKKAFSAIGRGLKTAFSKIGGALRGFFSTKVMPFLKKLISYPKNAVIIGGDIYFKSQRKDKNKKHPIVFSLYFGLIGAVLVGAFFSVAIFFGVRSVSEYYITEVYLSDSEKQAREERYIEDLQRFINEKGITAGDTARLEDWLGEWIEDNDYVFISVYDGDELLFSSIRNDPPEPNPDDKDEDRDKDGGTVGGILTGPTKDELLNEVAKITDTKQIKTADGEGVLLVKIYEYTEYFYRDMFTIMSLVIAMVVLAVVMVEHLSRIIMRIKRLQYDVNEVAAGHMDHEIVATGYDEITKLSYDVDNMRLSMLKNLEKEREALQMNTELITSMSHDIRTPLTVLMGYVDIMKSGLPPEEMEEYILASEKTVQRLKKLSDDMFKYFRAFGRGGEDITMEEYDAPTLFEQMLSEHVLLLTESGYNVRYDIEPLLAEQLIVRTDAPHLMRIIDNIFSNIYKYADAEKEVSIIGAREGELAVFEFSNTVAKDNKAESSKVGLKTCKRLSEYILNSFEYGVEDDIFTLRFSLRLYESGTKISESFVIR